MPRSRVSSSSSDSRHSSHLTVAKLQHPKVSYTTTYTQKVTAPQNKPDKTLPTEQLGAILSSTSPYWREHSPHFSQATPSINYELARASERDHHTPSYPGLSSKRQIPDVSCLVLGGCLCCGGKNTREHGIAQPMSLGHWQHRRKITPSCVTSSHLDTARWKTHSSRAQPSNWRYEVRTVAITTIRHNTAGPEEA